MIKVGSNNLAILKSVSWIKHNFEKAILIEDIAGMANMSFSAFHRLFKTVTGFSPLQYQKRVSLYEAQHLLFSVGQNVSSAAFSSATNRVHNSSENTNGCLDNLLLRT